MAAKKNKWYAYVVPSKNKRGIVSSWTECERIVKGIPGARFKGFATREEAKRWLTLGARYEVKTVKNLTRGIYFDAGTGRGQGVEISVTDEKGKNLLHKALSRDQLNQFGKHLVGTPRSFGTVPKERGREVTNNFGELLAMKYALEIAKKTKIKKIFGDSKLVIDFWSKWRVKKDVAAETFALAREVAKLRAEFEKSGGEVCRVPGDDNPADLGFHK